MEEDRQTRWSWVAWGRLVPRPIEATHATGQQGLVLLLRLGFWLVAHTLYRVRVLGREHVPARGGALFICNHLSFVDVALLSASSERPIRFLMHRDFFESTWLRPFARLLGAIPVSAEMRPRELIGTLRSAGEAVRQGEIVCIFAEGQISRIGQLLPFARGLERIMRGVEAPIVPVCLDGVWGSVFSYSRRRFFWKAPERLFEPVTVSYGRPLPSTAAAFEVRQAVQELLSDAWALRRTRVRSLGQAFVRSARRHPWRLALADGISGPLRYGSALIKVVYLARRLGPHWAGQEQVGLLLPPSVGGALVNDAALLLGKVPVNLSYTVSEEILGSCIRQCGLETVVTTRPFLERLKQGLPRSVRTLYLEELAARPRWGEKLIASALAWGAPAALLPRWLGGRVAGGDDLATIIFSSGSTGQPKGVMLTHFNIATNVEQIAQTFALHRRDRIVGILPFFHSFGFTATLALPNALGVGVVYHANPFEARSVGMLVCRYAATLLLATPTFLQTYIRRCPAELLGSLEYVLTGAEKLSERVATAFEERFGLRPLEGYGCTECAPAVCVSTRDFRAAGYRQVGAKRGKIGQPLPGVSVRVVDVESGASLPPGQSGVLVVRGPNVMKGYLGLPDQTAAVLRDGWYVTGDVAVMDADGFVEITDRLSRFSKIAGEMVPHVRVEEALHGLAGLTEQSFVVAGVPDERKGEHLVVLHTLAGERLSTVVERLPHSGLPKLWLPRSQHFFRVEAFPYLGTGKLDLRQVQEVALRLAA